MSNKSLLKRISAAAIIALDTFIVVYAFADLFMVLYLGYSMPRGAVPWYYQKQIMSDGCIVWHVDTTPALVLASLIAPMGGIVFDRRITTKRRRGIAPIIIVITAGAILSAAGAITAKSFLYCPLSCKQWTCNGIPPYECSSFPTQYCKCKP